MCISALISPILIVSTIALSLDNEAFQCCFSSVPGRKLRFTAVNCHSSVRIVSKLQTRMKVIQTAPSMLGKRIKEKHGSSEREHPGDSVPPAHPMENDRGLQSSIG